MRIVLARCRCFPVLRYNNKTSGITAAVSTGWFALPSHIEVRAFSLCSRVKSSNASVTPELGLPLGLIRQYLRIAKQTVKKKIIKTITKTETCTVHFGGREKGVRKRKCGFEVASRSSTIRFAQLDPAFRLGASWSSRQRVGCH